MKYILILLLSLGILQAEEFKRYAADGKTVTGVLIEEERDGVIYAVEKEFYKSGKVKSETPFKDDKEYGIAKEYYPDGKLKGEAEYINGREVGVQKSYYPDGKLASLSEGKWINDVWNGVSKSYHQDGSLDLELVISKDDIVGYKYDENGKKREMTKTELMALMQAVDDEDN